MALFIEILLDWDNDAARRRVTGTLQNAFCVVNVWSSNNRGNPTGIARLMFSLTNRTFYGESIYA
jgi:hypothetical protein